MKIQKSYEKDGKGILYVVPTPIGNLDDITYRALNVLKEATIIAAEDTRNTMKLLNHFSIATPLISYHEHNKRGRGEQLIERLKKGDSIALVSDAGMPAISDPGYEVVRDAIAQDIKVVVLPGANAALCALVGSGLPSEHFYFYGFLPRKPKEKKKELEKLKPLEATLIFYESPYRVSDTLQDLYSVFGNRNIAVVREISKRFEEYVRGNLEELIDVYKNKQLKGEFWFVSSFSR
jgi:16S rRNA (cytidine1402-2'-O)-methyltransferase